MTVDGTKAVLAALFNVVAVLLLAPLFEGVVRRITARVQSRQGPPILQPYYDLLKLLGKEDVESGEAPAMQRFAAHLSLAVALAIGCMVPMGFGPPLDGWGDAMQLVYLMTFSGVCTILAALAAGSTFSLVGMSREMMSMVALEPLFAVAVIIGAIHSGSLRLDAVMAGSVYLSDGFPMSGLMMLGIVGLSFQAFVQRVPFDISEAETEIMEGPLVEYSGPKLALFKYARMIKLVTYSALFVALFAPWGSSLPFLIGALLTWLKIFALICVVTLVAATHARYRIDQALRYFAWLLGGSMVALILASHAM